MEVLSRADRDYLRRSSDVSIYVSGNASHDVGGTMCVEALVFEEASQTKRVPCPVGTRGRYVTVAKWAAYSGLEVAEVSVYAAVYGESGSSSLQAPWAPVAGSGSVGCTHARYPDAVSCWPVARTWCPCPHPRVHTACMSRRAIGRWHAACCMQCHALAHRRATCLSSRTATPAPTWCVARWRPAPRYRSWSATAMRGRAAWPSLCCAWPASALMAMR